MVDGQSNEGSVPPMEGGRGAEDGTEGGRGDGRSGAEGGGETGEYDKDKDRTRDGEDRKVKRDGTCWDDGEEEGWVGCIIAVSNSCEEEAERGFTLAAGGWQRYVEEADGNEESV